MPDLRAFSSWPLLRRFLPPYPLPRFKVSTIVCFQFRLVRGTGNQFGVLSLQSECLWVRASARPRQRYAIANTMLLFQQPNKRSENQIPGQMRVPLNLYSLATY